jgi:hypothetical protein
MALSAQEKADVIFQLGWPGLSIVEGSTDYSGILVGRLTTISDPMVLQVRALLTRVAAIDQKLVAAPGRMLAKKIGDIELRDGEAALLRNEKRAVLRELSDLLDIPIQRSGGMMSGVCV